MANIDGARGLVPVDPILRVTAYHVPSSYGTALFIGDPVTQSGTANTAAVLGADGDYAIGTLNGVIVGVVGTANIIGAIVGFSRHPTDDRSVHKTASTERVVYVADHPDQRFKIQSDNTAIGAASIGLNAVLISGTGSATTGQSGFELDGGTSTAPAADATYQLHILASSKDPLRNDTTLANNEVIVRINQHGLANNEVGL